MNKWINKRVKASFFLFIFFLLICFFLFLDLFLHFLMKFVSYSSSSQQGKLLHFFEFLHNDTNTSPLHFFMMICSPSVTLSTNLWLFGTYLKTNLALVGLSTSSYIPRLVNYCQELAYVLILGTFLIYPAGISFSASIIYVVANIIYNNVEITISSPRYRKGTWAKPK